ncbi:MAG: phosphoribosyltransferase [Clostridiales bacterium]|nr:phosphoribosyltransferase [Candidatus Blautia equi]
MESKMFKIYAKRDDAIQLKIYPGHFATPQSHITHYLDMTTMKSRLSEAQHIAHALAQNYEASIPVDTIICMDGLEVVGSLLAEELTQAGILSMNAHKTMYITSPESSNAGQLIFRDNVQPMIRDKNILILIGSVTTGETLRHAISTILYYGGSIRGVSAIFSAVNSVAGLPVYSLFSQKDIPDYSTYRIHECPLCQNKQKLDAIVNGYGYSKL